MAMRPPRSNTFFSFSPVIEGNTRQQRKKEQKSFIQKEMKGKGQERNTFGWI